MMEWKEVRLGDVLINFDKKRKPLSATQRKSFQGIYRYYGAQGIIDYVKDYIFDGTYLLIAEDGENLNSRKEPIAQIVKGKFWVNNHAHIVQTNEKMNLYYLMRILNLTNISGFITGAAQPKLNQDNLNRITLTVPSRETQDRIASILSSLDKKIETNNKINANLEEMAQAIFKNWFVDFAPFKDGKFVESELGMIPEGWRVGTLSEVASFISRGISPKYDTTTDEWVLGQTCVRNNIVTLNNARTHLPKKKNEKWVKQWDVLINSTGMGSLGRVGIVYFDKDNVALDSHLTVVRVDNQQLRHYIGRNLLSRQGEIENMAVGSTGQTELPRDSVKGMKIIIPNADDIEPFNKTIEAIALKIYSHLMQNQQLATLRDTLLPRLMSGEIEV